MSVSYAFSGNHILETGVKRVIHVSAWIMGSCGTAALPRELKRMMNTGSVCASRNSGSFLTRGEIIGALAYFRCS